MSSSDAFQQLVEIMARLRAPGGCPWDREQDHQSIKPYLIEETYEVVEAIESGDDAELCTELGDLLLQVVFHAQMASETDRFGIADVIEAINQKLIRRHPHVFAETQVSGSSEVLRNWSKIKAEERKDSADRSALAGVPRAMPALLRAHRLGEKAAHVGFDWTEIAGVLAKLREEMAELEEAVSSGAQPAIEAELGDLLLAATSVARHVRVNSEDALARASDRFEKRFRHMESALETDGREIAGLSMDEMDALWARAKKALSDSR